MAQALHYLKKLDYPCNSKSEIRNVCNAVEGQGLQAMKIVHHYVNGRFDWLISGQQSVNPSRESISILYGKYERFSLVHPVTESNFQDRHRLINDAFHLIVNNTFSFLTLMNKTLIVRTAFNG